MDKLQLLDYYSTHYLSKQEIMFKLPFSISAADFWQELVNRRKMKAAVLPLYNAQGKPYWYVMTDKMIRASEILCEEAMAHEEADPYRMEMTTAMTWEMFFTSYVEGVQMDMDNALDYLSCDAEPADAQEQLLWNNRQAIAAMAGGIFRPINEEFTLRLAYLLTQDLDGTAESYRETDTLPIAAMQGESYLVPAASDIPMRMNELYAFLNKSDVHPLIKSAVSQAFILAVRPFPDGNERLSRILSTLILYRSGYDFFRDISISRKIAKESYRYYKNMQELLRQENDADMTCFVEYYIDLLARALTEAKENAALREKEAAEKTISEEREMSVIPLSSPLHDETKNPAIDVGDILNGAQSVSILTSEAAEVQSNPSLKINQKRKADFYQILDSFCQSKSPDVKRMGAIAKQLLEQGITHFTTLQWAEYAQLDSTTAKNNCYYMRKRGLLENHGNYAEADYYFCRDEEESESTDFPKDDSAPNVKGSPKKADFNETFSATLHELQESQNIRESRFAQTLLALVNNGQLSFTSSDWAHTGGISPATAEKDLRDVIGMGLVYRTGDTKQYVYHIGESPNGNSGMEISKTQSDILRRLSKIFDGRFTAKQAAEKLDMNRNTLIYHLKYLMINGKLTSVSGSYPPVYEIKGDVCNDKSDDTASISEIITLQPQARAAAWA